MKHSCNTYQYFFYTTLKNFNLDKQTKNFNFMMKLVMTKLTKSNL